MIQTSLFAEPPPPALGPAPAYAQVAIERGVDKVLDYLVPPRLTTVIRVGQRVRVPLGRGNKPVHGYVVALTARSAYPSVKPILSIGDERPLVTPALMQLALWMARYYCTPLGAVLESVVPSAVKRKVGLDYTAIVRRAMPRERVQELLEKTKAPKRRGLLAHLLQIRDDQEIELARLAAQTHVTPATVRKLAGLGVIAIESRADFASLVGDKGGAHIVPDSTVPELNDDQRTVFDELGPRVAAGGFSVNLLHGVTGSGKTEIYLRCIKEAVDRGRRAIVLVPEIALTPQTAARFTARFNRVAILHSGLSASQRHAYWQQIFQGQADVVVGARSAVFAPAPDLGVIVVDEEHEASYKQDSAPRYHGRDVAVKRAQLEAIPIILGSATPSLEMYYRVSGQWSAASRQSAVGGGEAVAQTFLSVPENQAPIQNQGAKTQDPSSEISDPKSKIENPKSPIPAPPVPSPQAPSPTPEPYHLLRLPRRVRGLSLPTVELVDMKQEARSRKGVHLLSRRLEAMLRTTLSQGRQAILLLNRRGYSSYVYCPSCQNAMQCKYCDVTMTYHRASGLSPHTARSAAGVHTGQLHCHYCLAVDALPDHCPSCGKNLTLFGLGTQRVEEELIRKFPELKFARVDSDSMHTARDYEAMLERFGAGQLHALLGTQMIAKGLDYPNVTLVGVISADTALALPDFRAAERTFQLITQVAGRAGRGDAPGRVIVQTFQPDSPAITCAISQDFDGFAATELPHRRAVGLPPFSRLVRIVLRDQDAQHLQERSLKVMECLAPAIAAAGSLVTARGPMPCLINRIAGHHRQQIVLYSPKVAALQSILASGREQGVLAAGDRVAVDVDPVSLL